MQYKSFWAILGILFWALSFIPFKIGYEKITLVTFDTFASIPHKYVGGDAYNFIINSTQSESYFLLACTCVICGFLSFILYYLTNKNADTTNNIEHKQEN